MNLFLDAIKTYDTNAHLAGVYLDGDKEPLCPICHIIQNAHIEIYLDGNGKFQKANIVEKENVRTIIPATEGSFSRAGKAIRAHPLCDQIEFVSNISPKKHSDYLRQLSFWTAHGSATPLVRAVYQYVDGGTILQDLSGEGIIKLEADGSLASGRINGILYHKCLVRWVVDDIQCWRDIPTFEAYQQYYLSIKAAETPNICSLTGELTSIAKAYEKGTIQYASGAKLLSANDFYGFTYRGTYDDPDKNFRIGYESSQKMYKALRWVIANNGTTLGIGTGNPRTFVAWNPNGSKVLQPFSTFMPKNADPDTRAKCCRDNIRGAILGYRDLLPANEEVVFAVFEPSSEGRLSIVSFNKMLASEYYDKIERWYETMCWSHYYFGTTTPSLKQIATYTYGVPKKDSLSSICIGDGIYKVCMSELTNCLLFDMPIPSNMVKALVDRAARLILYSPNDREMLLNTACAVVNRNLDKQNEEEWTMVLDKSKQDRSYQFGRLLATLERVELNTYDVKEKKDPMALRQQTAFCSHPMRTATYILNGIQPYFQKLDTKIRKKYRDLIDEIMSNISASSESELNRPLRDTWLLGYSLQRIDFKNNSTPNTNKH